MHRILQQLPLVILQGWVYDDKGTWETWFFRKDRLKRMRKKSHISLARYIVANTTDEGLKKHWLSFYIGSVLPDCKPSFLYRRHEITGTFPQLKQDIVALICGKEDRLPKRKRLYYMNLGEITHYVADYFTFPHNKIYPGGFREHCAYEERLKRELRAFLKTEAPNALNVRGNCRFSSPEALLSYIQNMHERYLSSPIDTAKDIEHIVLVNKQVVDGIDELFWQNHMQHRIA